MVGSLNHRVKMIITRIEDPDTVDCKAYQMLDRKAIGTRLSKHAVDDTNFKLLKTLKGTEFHIQALPVGSLIKKATHRDYIRCYRDCFAWYATCIKLPSGFLKCTIWNEKLVLLDYKFRSCTQNSYYQNYTLFLMGGGLET